MRLRMLALTVLAVLPVALGYGAAKRNVRVDVTGRSLSGQQVLNVKGSWAAVKNPNGSYELTRPAATAVLTYGSRSVVIKLGAGHLGFVGADDHAIFRVFGKVTSSNTKTCPKGSEVEIRWSARSKSNHQYMGLNCHGGDLVVNYGYQGKNGNIGTVGGTIRNPRGPTHPPEPPSLPNVFTLEVNGTTSTQHINGASTGDYKTITLVEGKTVIIHASLDDPLPAKDGWYAYTERTGDPESTSAQYFRPCTLKPGEKSCPAAERPSGKAGQQEVVSFQVGRAAGGRFATITINWVEKG